MDYTTEPLTKSELNSDPMLQFRVWYAAVVNVEPEANAMALATLAGDEPAVRMVLLKGIDERGFVFFTHYDSHKGQQIEINPRVSLLFWWASCHRQVRITGQVEKVTAAASRAYFQSRPRGAQIAASVSPQSQPVGSRQKLEAQYHDFEQQHIGEIACPSAWGGYRVVPSAYEFWQGANNRFHDRFVYRQDDAGWVMTRLAP